MRKLYSTEEKQMMIEMYEAGITKGMIERIFGVSSGALNKYLSQDSVPRVKGIDKERSKKLIKKATDERIIKNTDIATLMLKMIDDVDLSEKGYKKRREMRESMNHIVLRETELSQMGEQGLKRVLMKSSETTRDDEEER